MKNILFVCVHNSARSQIAEAFVNEKCAGLYRAYSAGLERGSLNPIVVEVMAEVGLDISGNQSKTVDDILATGTEFDFVVSVCDGANADRCPLFPGGGQRLHWPFTDPSSLTGTHEEKLITTREVRDQIRREVDLWCGMHCAESPTAA